jgi:hypothetical protein
MVRPIWTSTASDFLIDYKSRSCPRQSCSARLAILNDRAPVLYCREGKMKELIARKCFRKKRLEVSTDGKDVYSVNKSCPS